MMSIVEIILKSYYGHVSKLQYWYHWQRDCVSDSLCINVSLHQIKKSFVSPYPNILDMQSKNKETP